MSHDLLTTPTFSLRIGEQRTKEPLPGVLAHLGAGEDVVFEAAQTYQEHPIYSTLVYLAAFTLHKMGKTDPNLTEDQWRDSLTKITVPGAWDLFEADITKPAFLQQPTTPQIFDGNVAMTPDEIDTIAASANHSRKKRLIALSAPEHWAYALLSLQAASISVALYMGTSRATSSGRVCVSVTPSLSLGVRFLRDVALALERRHSIVTEYSLRSEGGIGLVWVEPWDGTTSLALSQVDPFYIDAPRLVRLRDEDGRIVGYRRDTRADGHGVPRIKGMPGAGGDLWTPTTKKKDKDILAVGFKSSTETVSAENLHNLVFVPERPVSAHGNFHGPGYLLVQGIFRDKGKTLGYHEKIIPLSDEAVKDLRKKNRESFVALCSKDMVNEVATVSKALETALVLLLVGKSEKDSSTHDREHASASLSKIMVGFKSAVDANFFDYLFQRPENNDRTPWFLFLMQAARDVLNNVPRTSVHHGSRYYAGLSAATRVLDEFEAKSRKQIGLEPPEGEETVTDPVMLTYTNCHETVSRIHSKMVGLKHSNLGAYAKLRRLDPDRPVGKDFFEIEESIIDKSTAPRDPMIDQQEHERRWSVIVRSAALVVGLHVNGDTGRAIAKAGISPMRFERFLNATEGDALDGCFDQIIRFMRQKQERFNLTDLAFIYLWPSSSEANNVRRRIAKSYYHWSSQNRKSA